MRLHEIALILTNYKRPGNLRRILDAYKTQTKPPDRVVIADNSPCGFDVPSSVAAEVDDVFKMSTNLGPSCRFVPALADTRSKYILFADDDFVPHKNLVSAATCLAVSIKDDFATIGSVGRRFRLSRVKYLARNVDRSSHAVPVDMTCRWHFVRRDMLSRVIAFRDTLISRFANHALLDEVLLHDDMLLALGIQQYLYVSSYLLPAQSGTGIRNIDDSHSFSSRTSGKHHKLVRTTAIKMAREVGWRRRWTEA